MVPERVLLGGAAAVVVVSAVAVAAVPGALSPEEPDRIRPAVLGIAEVNIAAGAVAGDAATLSVETRLDHRGGPAENVTLLVRAIGLESGLVETRRAVDVAPIEGSREVPVTTNLTVAREGGYRIETVVFQDGERRATAAKAVRGVEALPPEYAQTPVEFHRFTRTDQPVIEYAVADVRDGRATLRVQSYLTNTGSDVPSDLRLSLSARQADSNIVADETEVSIGEIEPGRTATPEAELVVPDGYNYYLDAILWKDGVIVGTARSVANLDPSETISANVTRREVGLEVSDFEEDGDGVCRTARLHGRARDRGVTGCRAPDQAVVGVSEDAADEASERGSERAGEERTGDDETGGVLADADVWRALRLGAIGLLALLALVATFQLYTNTSAAIAQWVSRDYVSVFQAAFNLVVLLLSLAGLGTLARHR